MQDRLNFLSLAGVACPLREALGVRLRQARPGPHGDDVRDFHDLGARSQEIRERL